MRDLIDLHPCVKLCYCVTNSLEKESWTFTLLKSFFIMNKLFIYY